MTIRTTLALAGSLAIAMLAASGSAHAANDNPCFKPYSPPGAVYWSGGPNGGCVPLNTYHAPNVNPDAPSVRRFPSAVQFKQNGSQFAKPRRFR